MRFVGQRIKYGLKQQPRICYSRLADHFTCWLILEKFVSAASIVCHFRRSSRDKVARRRSIRYAQETAKYCLCCWSTAKDKRVLKEFLDGKRNAHTNLMSKQRRIQPTLLEER